MSQPASIHRGFKFTFSPFDKFLYGGEKCRCALLGIDQAQGYANVAAGIILTSTLLLK